MSGFDDIFKKIFERGEKIDPLSHKALKAIVKMDSKGVREVSKGVDRLLGGNGDNFLSREAGKNVNDPVRGIGRAAATVGALYGGAALAGSGGGAVAAAPEAGATAGGGAAFNAAADSQLANAGGAAVWSGAPEGVSGSTVSTSSPSSVNLGSLGNQGFSPQFQKLLSMRQPMQQPQMAPIKDVEVAENPYLDDLALSSKKAKKPARSVDQAIQRGARRENPIDTTGVQMAAIKALNQRFKRIEAAAIKQRGTR